MYKIQTLNKIAAEGLEKFPRDQYEVASEFSNPDAIVVRSFDMHSSELPEGLKAIARAGAGVNNIPIDRCSEKGIMVFNTPGANANSVKELVFAGMFMAARNLPKALSWVQSIKEKGDEVPKLIEKEKSNFKGTELRGKTLGIIGLGAIGAQVANDALAMGMNVIGSDPFISVDAAWDLSREVKKASSVNSLISQSDYISVHVPLTDNTRGMLHKDQFAIMKKGVVVLNFARGGLINDKDMKDAIEEGIVSYYVTDFPDGDLVGHPNIICIPHLGASSQEAEVNCAVMAANQVRSYLETGNLKNCINYPDCEMEMTGDTRIVVANKNIPNMVGQITAVLAEEAINIEDMLNRHKKDYAYTIIDVKGEISPDALDKIRSIDGVVMVRQIG